MRSRHYIGIALISLGTLLLELTLTRVLSVALWYHFGFLVISTALLGFGSSGVVLSVWTWLREEAPLRGSLALLSMAFGVTTIVSFWAMQRVPFDPFRQFADPRQLILMPLYYVLLAAPFFCSGLAIALLFTRGTAAINRLYAFDLLGAGLGCAAIAITMPTFGGSGSVVVAATLGFLAAATFAWGETQRTVRVVAFVIAVAAATLAFAAERVLQISVAELKQHSLMPDPPRPEPVYTAWNTFSRIDVYEHPARPSEGWPHAGYAIIIDSGTAGTGMGDLSEGVDAFLADSASYRPSGFAFVGKESPNVLIIGSGAGRGVLEALHFGASSITAVEINPIINRIVTREMREQWGGLFERPEVKLVTEEGRSFVRRSKEQYDMIISVQTVSNAAMASGALSLSENYMFTREAVEDFIDHLTAEGVLLITRPHSQIARLFATVREVFDRRELGSPADHLVAFRTPVLIWGARHPHTGLLFKKTPFTAKEIEEIKQRLATHDGDAAGHDDRSPEVLYAPFEPVSDSIFEQILTAGDVQVVYDRHPFDISPVTDDRPFFNQQTRWRDVRLGSWIAANMSPGAESVLVILLIQSILVAGLLILLPLFRFSRQGLPSDGRWSFLIYFSGLGLGFIMIEIALLQRFTLFLGQPVYTFAVILASLLVFTGMGSYLAGRFREISLRTFLLVGALLLGALLITELATPVVFTAALGLELFWRVVISVVMIAPLSIFLGMPFPTGLRVVDQEAPALVPWAWGVNGFFTVIGSVGAIILGMSFGFTSVLLVAGLFYLAAFLIICVRRARRPFLGSSVVVVRGP